MKEESNVRLHCLSFICFSSRLEVSSGVYKRLTPLAGYGRRNSRGPIMQISPLRETVTADGVLNSSSDPGFDFTRARALVVSPLELLRLTARAFGVRGGRTDGPRRAPTPLNGRRAALDACTVVRRRALITGRVGRSARVTRSSTPTTVKWRLPNALPPPPSFPTSFVFVFGHSSPS